MHWPAELRRSVLLLLVCLHAVQLPLLRVWLQPAASCSFAAQLDDALYITPLCEDVIYGCNTLDSESVGTWATKLLQGGRLSNLCPLREATEPKDLQAMIGSLAPAMPLSTRSTPYAPM